MSAPSLMTRLLLEPSTTFCKMQEDNKDDTADIEAELGIEVDRSDHGARQLFSSPLLAFLSHHSALPCTASPKV